jgi:hypothetical protein
VFGSEVEFVRVIKTYGGQRPPPNSASSRNNRGNDGVVMKAKRVCHVRKKVDVERAMAKQDEFWWTAAGLLGPPASVTPEQQLDKMHIHQVNKIVFTLCLFYFWNLKTDIKILKSFRTRRQVLMRIF